MAKRKDSILVDMVVSLGFFGQVRPGFSAWQSSRLGPVTATCVSVPTRRVTGTVGPCCLPVSRTFCAESRCPSRVVYAVRVALSESLRPSRRGAVPTILSVRVARRHQRPGPGTRDWQLEHPVGPGPPAAYVGGSSNVFRRLINFGPGRNGNFKAEFNGSVRKPGIRCCPEWLMRVSEPGIGSRCSVSACSVHHDFKSISFSFSESD